MALAFCDAEVRRDVLRRLGGSAEIVALRAETSLSFLRQFAESPSEVLVFSPGKPRRITGDVVAILKRLFPTTLLILHSPEPTDEDGAIVQEGVYYYAAGTGSALLAEAIRSALERTRRTW